MRAKEKNGAAEVRQLQDELSRSARITVESFPREVEEAQAKLTGVLIGRAMTLIARACSINGVEGVDATAPHTLDPSTAIVSS